jgi:PDDEXK-like domain of unknown function (DUF3799)
MVMSNPVGSVNLAKNRKLNFSSLKHMARSPAHYLAAIARPFAPTRDMRVGTLVHRRILGGPPPVVYMGERRGKAWEAFRSEHAGKDIFTESEAEDADAIAESVECHGGAMSMLIEAQTEVPLEWEAFGFEWRTGGVDFIGPGAWGDLKTCRNSEPEAFARDATRMLYYAQLAAYQDAMRANGYPDRPCKIIAVESSDPYPVTILRVSDAVLEIGRSSLAMWCARLRACIDSDHWPGYVDSEVEFELPRWMGASDDDD